MSDHLVVFTTMPDEESALSLAKHLVHELLAACVNIQAPMTSVYMWKGKEETGFEHLLMIKTRAEQYPELEQAIVSRHPYKLPEIIACPIVRGLHGYLDWIVENTT